MNWSIFFISFSTGFGLLLFIAVAVLIADFSLKIEKQSVEILETSSKAIKLWTGGSP